MTPCRLTYRTSAARTTLDTSSPRASAVALAAFHRSLGTRTFRAVVATSETLRAETPPLNLGEYDAHLCRHEITRSKFQECRISEALTIGSHHVHELPANPSDHVPARLALRHAPDEGAVHGHGGHVMPSGVAAPGAVGGLSGLSDRHTHNRTHNRTHASRGL